MSEIFDDISPWIIKGDHDLGTAKITYLHIPEYLDTVVFHCQQAVEKYLKAYQIYLEIPIKRTHDLVYLIDIISQKDETYLKLYDTVSELESYAVEIRYPNETIFLTSEKIEKAIEVAKMIRKKVTNDMCISIKYNEIIDK
jgi:HEPN domain-containing protein